MDKSQHLALRNKFLQGREQSRKQTVEDRQKFLDNFAFRWYFMEKTTGITVTPETSAWKLLAFEKMVRKDPSFTFKEE